MNHLVAIATVLTMLSPQNLDLPNEISQLPESIRESATVIVAGTFGQGRTPCMLRPDGTRVWGLWSWFTVKKVYRGKVGSRSISINSTRIPASTYVTQKLIREHDYLVLLRPRAETMKKIQTKEGNGFWDSVEDGEIIAILEK